VGEVTEVSRRRFVASTLSAAALAALPAGSVADSKIEKMGGNEMTTLTIPVVRWQMPAGHGVLQILFWRRTDREQG
jgi:hypothetical protein